MRTITRSKRKTLETIARDIRRDILTMSYLAQSAHTGGALSCVEILVALYFRIMKVYPGDPVNPRRDRLVFSKAHDAKALYAVLAERGFFDKKLLKGYEHDGGLLPGHSVRGIAGIEISSGSLGHGLPMAAGMAWVGKQDKKAYRVFAVLSDGECDEGSTWEAILFAGYHKLDNLIAIVDYNKLQGFGFTKDVLDLEPLKEKWQSFDWEVAEVDGHNIKKVIQTFRTLPFRNGKPSVIIAHTIKGLGGVARYIGTVSSQYKAPTEKEFDKALKDLEAV